MPSPGGQEDRARIRWKGTGQAKLPELVRVDETIVNEQMLKDADAPTRRDSEIR